MKQIQKKSKIKRKSVTPMQVDTASDEEHVEDDASVDAEDAAEAASIADDDDDEMDLGNFKASTTENTKRTKRKKGIIYISNIPKYMNVTILREILGQFGKIGRVYLQPERQTGGGDKDKKKKRKRYNIHFTEGWVEFESKRVAKQIVPLLNNKQISTRKKSHFYDSLWSMKYLPRFKWVHLTERMNYEQAVHKQRLQTEVSQARKETTFFQNNLDKSEHLAKQAKKLKKLERKKQQEEA
ncbi:pre-rRNA-processing protein esf2-like [Scaptodrosophila lebanonensis]|uniref:Activator of basal transcription 1 n=1 Tax=Drosophila lebanonensis TaxID=7225 RepID=A0A6J2TQ28_DROLE|nr:pre-rRNA-processing protein esf2-like [Scaptodrosophila lebanonensis]